MAEINPKPPKPKRTANVGKGAQLVITEPVVAEITAPKCKVCHSPYRREIEWCLASGWSQVNVRRHFNQLIEAGGVPFTKQNISTHAQKHMRSMDAAIRKIWEERARQMGLDIDLAENFILTEEGVFDAVIYEGPNRIRSGAAALDARDVLQAVKDRDKRRESQNEIAVDAVMNEFKEFMQAIKEAHERYLTPGREITSKSVDEINALGFEIFQERMDRMQQRIMSHNIDPPLELIQGVEVEDGDFEEVEND